MYALILEFEHETGRRGLFNLVPSVRSNVELEGKEYHERKLLNFSPEELYEVVLDIDSYEKFVPWCEQSRVVLHDKPGYLEAEMVVGFKVWTRGKETRQSDGCYISDSVL